MITFEMLNDNRIKHGFTTRNGGFSQGYYESNNFGFSVGDQIEDVMKNYHQLLHAMNLEDKTVLMCRQVHGNSVKVIKDEVFNKKFVTFDNYDGLITNRKDLVLITYHADCVPIYFYAPDHGVIGLAHAGWQGTAKKIVQVMLKKFYRVYGVPSKAVKVVIGPSADACCYEVDQRVMEEFNEKYFHDLREDGHCYLSMKEINRDLMLEMGVKKQYIEIAKECTICDQRFFSHRRENGKTGRMIAIFSLTSS